MKTIELRLTLDIPDDMRPQEAERLALAALARLERCRIDAALQPLPRLDVNLNPFFWCMADETKSAEHKLRGRVIWHDFDGVRVCERIHPDGSITWRVRHARRGVTFAPREMFEHAKRLGQGALFPT